MKATINVKRVRRWTFVTQAVVFLGFISLLGVVVIGLFMPELKPYLSLVLFLGVLFSALGIYTSSLWISRPRPEEVLDTGLKTLSHAHRIYHYYPCCEHLLLAPFGVIAIEVVSLEGKFAYRGGKWKQQVPIRRAFRVMFEPQLGDPLKRAEKKAAQIARLLSNKVVPGQEIPVFPWVVFTSPTAAVEVDDESLPIYSAQKIHRRVPVDLPRLPVDVYEKLQAYLDR